MADIQAHEHQPAGAQAQSGARDFQIQRDCLSKTRFVDLQLHEATDLAPGELLLRISSVALSANNITYAVLGERMRYWQFFPALSTLSDALSWGRLPVWGFADVIHSAHPEIAVGERIYGYLPMSTHLLVLAGRVSAKGFVDASPHRAALPAVYQQYRRCAQDQNYAPQNEALQALLLPLLFTAFLLCDEIIARIPAGKSTVILTSASSKTALATAFLLQALRPEACEVIALTSAKHLDFVRERGCFDRVLEYHDVESLAPDQSAIAVDFSGNVALMARIHQHCRGLQHSLRIGVTHWHEAAGMAEPKVFAVKHIGPKVFAGQHIGPRPELFFAPDYAAKRVAQWGAVEFERRTGAAWMAMLLWAQNWLKVRTDCGEEAIADAYLAALNGVSPADVGQMLAFKTWQDSN